MALHLPPAVSVSRFVGGYKSVSDYTDLEDTETNDAANTVYGPNGDIDQRPGCRRLLRVKLANSATPTVGEPITGHYYFDKLGAGTSYHVVAAGDSLYNYTSSTAVAIATALTDNSNTFWNMVQIQDPRSAADDMVIMTNGVDSIKVWNGSATAVALNSFTSATQVPICKYLLVHKERVYAINIVNSADVDAGVKVAVSGFGTDGAADPHRFREAFYVGGSSRGGEIRGARVLNDQIFFFTRNSAWKYSPVTGGLGELQQLQGSVGIVAPFSLVDCGNFVIFLSERGIYGFDGVSFVHLSEKIDDELLTSANLGQLQYAKAEYNKRDNQYIIYYASGSSDRNNRAMVYDLRLKCWQPPVSGRRVSFISNFDDSDGIERIILGDYHGFLSEDHIGINDGLETGFNGTVTTGGYTGITDASANFTTTGDGLAGFVVKLTEGSGADQERVILSNTSAVLTLESDWDIPPDTTTQYSIAGIDAYWRSKDYEFGNHDLVKVFRHVRLRVREEGSFNLTLHYIVDFKDLVQATRKDVQLLEDGLAWDFGRWGAARWDARATIRRKISLRNTVNQRTNGTHLALRFANRRANESFRLSGYDMELKPIGKR